MLQITLPYFSENYITGFLLTKQAILHMNAWRWSFFIHISTSIFVLLFGVFQFIKAIQVRYTAFHRALGKAYVFIVLFLAAPSGLVMALYANGGWWARISFIIISLLWWIFTFKAWRDIMNKKLQSHIANMTRSYALTLTAITLRTYVVVLPSLIHLHAKEMYTLVAWLSWVPNLLVAEWLIRKKAFR
jgi:hypothetical protein